MKLKIALLAATGALALASAAHAEDQGYYGALGFGYTFAEDSNDFEGDAVFAPGGGCNIDPGFSCGGQADFVTDYDLDAGINIYGEVGAYWHGGWRGGLELATRTQDVDELPGDGLGFAGFATDGNIGDVTVTTLMANVYYDFYNSSAFTPYVGFGIGGAQLRTEVDNSALTGAATAPGQPYMIVMGDKDIKFAGQAMAGVNVDITETVDFDVRYKYLLTDTFEYGAAINGPVSEVGGQYEAQEITVGLRWDFGQPAPVVYEEPVPVVTYKDCWDGSRVPTTESCPPELVEEVVAPDYLDLTVYFDFDKYNLTTAAQDLIAAKADEALQYDISAVTVQGNTDTSGSASYNNALSARRAGVVESALVGNGIPESLITTQALGETNPAKPTADGVREPLNRRTEVTFDF